MLEPFAIAIDDDERRRERGQLLDDVQAGRTGASNDDVVSKPFDVAGHASASESLAVDAVVDRVAEAPASAAELVDDERAGEDDDGQRENRRRDAQPTLGSAAAD